LKELQAITRQNDADAYGKLATQWPYNKNKLELKSNLSDAITFVCIFLYLRV